MLTGLAHTGVCVPDVEEAVAWYESVLGLRVLSPPYLMSGPEIERDMGELVPGVAIKAAILGFAHGDHVLEVIEYPGSPGRRRGDHRSITDAGFSHVGLVCDDIAATRADLEARGVGFLTTGVAGIAGLRTTWFQDPYGLVFILMEKGSADRPYYRQFTPR
ncbi:MAG TPA: VOC family protein [Acidimicrobiales bacterium]|jgi:catechol 2,3-dioxygenase-like lactoylglutathione lyase family enzyme